MSITFTMLGTVTGVYDVAVTNNGSTATITLHDSIKSNSTLDYLFDSALWYPSSASWYSDATYGTGVYYNAGAKYLTTGYKQYTSRSYTVNLDHSSHTYTFKAYLSCGNDYAGSDQRSGTFNVTIPAKQSWTVSYNANGGSGAPGNQTKWHNETLTLSSTVPTRAGYTFVRWNTNSSGTGTNYNGGASYTGNGALTLYAVWSKNLNMTEVSAVRVGSDGETASQVGGRLKVSFGWRCDTTASGDFPSTFSVTAVPSNSSLPTVTGVYDNSGGPFTGSAYLVIGDSETYHDETVYRVIRPDVTYTVTVVANSTNVTSAMSYSLPAATSSEYSKPTVSVNSSRSTSGKSHDICGEYVYLTASYTASTELYLFTASFDSGTPEDFTYDSQENTAEALLGPYTATQLRPETAYTASISIADKFYTTTVSKAIPMETAYAAPTVTITSVERVASDGTTPDALGGYVKVLGRYTMTETATQPVPVSSYGKLSDTQNGEPLPTVLDYEIQEGLTVSKNITKAVYPNDDPTNVTYSNDYFTRYAEAVSGANPGTYMYENAILTAQVEGAGASGHTEDYWYYFLGVDLGETPIQNISVTRAYCICHMRNDVLYMNEYQDVWENVESGDTHVLPYEPEHSSSFRITASVYMVAPAPSSGSLGIGGTTSENDEVFTYGTPAVGSYVSYDGDKTFTATSGVDGWNTTVTFKYYMTSEAASVTLEQDFVPEEGKDLNDYLCSIDLSKEPANLFELDDTHTYFCFEHFNGCGWSDVPSGASASSFHVAGPLYVEYDIVTSAPSTGEARGPNTRSANRVLSNLFGQMTRAVLRPDGQYYVTFDVSDRFNTAYYTMVLPSSVGLQNGYSYPMISEVDPYRIDKNLQESDDGTDIAIEVDWSIYASVTQTKPEKFNVKIVSEDGVTVVNKDYDYNITSGKPSTIYLMAGEESEVEDEPLFEQDLQYTVTVTVMDQYSIATLSAILTSAFFTWDAKSGGHGIAFGKPSTREIMDVRFPGYFDSALHIAEELSLPVYVREKLPKSVVPSLPAIVIVSSGGSRSVYLATRGTQITAESFEAEMHTVKLNYDAPNSYWDPPNHAAAFEWPCTLESGNPGWYSDGEADSGDENPYWWTCVELPIEQGSFIYNIIDAYLETDTGAIRKFVPETGNGLNDYIVSLNPNNWPLGTNSPELDLDPQGVYFHFKHFEGCGWHPDSSEGKISGTFHVVYEVQTI